MAGVPVLSNDLPDCRALIEDFHAGRTVEVDTPEGWRGALLAMKEGGTTEFKPGLEKAGRQLRWTKESKVLQDIYAG